MTPLASEIRAWLASVAFRCMVKLWPKRDTAFWQALGPLATFMGKDL